MTCKNGNCGHNDTNCIALVPIFNFLLPAEMEEIHRIVKRQSYKRDQMIYYSGDINDNLYVIHEGLVKITKYSDEGKEQVIRILQPGDFMGDHHLFVSKTLEENAQALRDTEICVIKGEQLKQLMIKHPQIAFKILEEISLRLANAEKLLKNIATESVEKRIADFLISLSDENDIVALDMKKKDIASMLGMSAETLSRALSKLERNNIINQQKNHIIILDIDYLYNI